MRTLINNAAVVRFSCILCLSLFTYTPRMWAAEAKPSASVSWQVGTPIATYWAGPALSDAVAQQMVEGGFNLVWCRSEKELDVAGRHGLRGLLTNGLLTPASLNDPKRREQLDALISRVSMHPALYANHHGSLVSLDGVPGPLYHAVKSYNREFVAVARELQSLRSFGVYHQYRRSRSIGNQ